MTHYIAMGGEHGCPGHRVNVDAIKGKIIYYSADSMGMLEGFNTEEDGLW
jgi:hypothetical protein